MVDHATDAATISANETKNITATFIPPLSHPSGAAARDVPLSEAT